MRIKILIAAVAAVLVATAVPSLASAGTQRAAAAGCSGAGPTVTDYAGGRWATKYCHNYHGGQVGTLETATGYLYAGRNWFVCQRRFTGYPNPPVGNAKNNIWLYTQGDVSYSAVYKGWGWFPATYVSGGGNYDPIPGLRWC